MPIKTILRGEVVMDEAEVFETMANISTVELTG